MSVGKCPNIPLFLYETGIEAVEKMREAVGVFFLETVRAELVHCIPDVTCAHGNFWAAEMAVLLCFGALPAASSVTFDVGVVVVWVYGEDIFGSVDGGFSEEGVPQEPVVERGSAESEGRYVGPEVFCESEVVYSCRAVQFSAGEDVSSEFGLPVRITEVDGFFVIDVETQAGHEKLGKGTADYVESVEKIVHKYNVGVYIEKNVV